MHGTTKQAPLDRFTAVEQAALRPLPPTPYDLAVWKQAHVARDCHLTFEGAYYSVPYRLVGTAVLIRGGARTIEVYDADHQLVATHSRVAAGERQTHLWHLPAEKVPNLVLTREDCLAQARAIGPATTAVVQALLDHRPEDRLRSAGRLVRLAQRATPERLEQACARALVYGVSDYPTIKRILQAGLDAAAPIEVAAPSAARSTAGTYIFARSAAEFAAILLGGGCTVSVVRHPAGVPSSWPCVDLTARGRCGRGGRGCARPSASSGASPPRALRGLNHDGGSRGWPWGRARAAGRQAGGHGSPGCARRPHPSRRGTATCAPVTDSARRSSRRAGRRGAA
jgi:hypothetical protein